jgi:hypothetical protein
MSKTMFHTGRGSCATISLSIKLSSKDSGKQSYPNQSYSSWYIVPSNPLKVRCFREKYRLLQGTLAYLSVG